jgi:dihydroorotase-like cyclic amidohydrolase
MKMQNEIVKILMKIKAEESKDRIAKAACDILRALLILGGSSWEAELLDSIAAIAAFSGDLSSAASMQEIEEALSYLKKEGLIDFKRMQRANLTGISIIEENFYSLKNFIASMQVFGADKPVLRLRRGEI